MLVNTVYALFFVFMLVKNVWVSFIDCEFELIILVLYFGYEFYKVKQFIWKDALMNHLHTFPASQRYK